MDEVRIASYKSAEKKFREEHKTDKKHKAGRPKKGEEPVKDEYSKSIKGSKYALGKNPENLTEKQSAKLEMIRINEPTLYRAYRLKETLRLTFHMCDLDSIRAELKHWLFWASHCRIPEFIELGRKIRRHFEEIPRYYEVRIIHCQGRGNKQQDQTDHS